MLRSAAPYCDVLRGTARHCPHYASHVIMNIYFLTLDYDNDMQKFQHALKGN